MIFRLDRIQVFLKNTKCGSVIKGLPIIGLVAFSIGAFATDSAGLVGGLNYLPNLSKTQVTPSFTAATMQTLAPGQYPEAGTTGPSGVSARPCWRSNNSPYYRATVANPYQMIRDTGSAWYDVTVSGFYNIKAYFNWQMYNAPANIWLDEWATSVDTKGVSTEIRLFYTGDAPYQTLTTGVSEIYMYGSAYLAAGSKIYMPRIWFDAATNGQTAWCVDPTVTISLMSAP